MKLSALKQNYWYINRDWRIVNQIVVAQLIIIVVLLSFLLASILVSQHIMEQSLTEASNYAFVRQTAQSLNTIWIYQQNFEELLNSASQQISLVNYLYRAVEIFQENNNNFQTFPSLQCLNKPKTNDTFCYNSSNCYGLFGNVTTESLKELQPAMNVTSILTSFRVAIDNTQALYFSQKNDAQYYTLSQGFFFPKGFLPHKRPWYMYHLNQTKNSSDITEIVYGNPYVIFKGGIRIASTSNLINKEKHFDGVVAKDINFNQTQVFHTTHSYSSLMVIKKDGTVVYSKLYDIQNQSVFNIIDSNYSGFGETDFEQIIAFHHQQSFQSNCNDFLKENMLCRINSILNQSRIILTANITGSPYIMLLFIDPQQLLQQEKAQVTLINNQITSLAKQTILISCLTVLAIIVLGYFSIQVILQQLNLLIQHTNLKLINSAIVNVRNFENSYCFRTESVTALCLSIFSIMHDTKPQNKTMECLVEEKKLYPKQSDNNYQFQSRLVQEIVKSMSSVTFNHIPYQHRRKLLLNIKFDL